MEATSKSSPARRGWAFALTCAGLFSLAAWGHDAKKGCGGRGEATWAVPGAEVRIDFSPKHGGITFSAPNGYHHFEAVYLRPRLLKIYLYDAFGLPIQAAYFQGAVGFRGDTGRRRIPFRIANDGTLEAELPPRSYPLMVEARISYGGPSAGPKAFEEVFTLGFDRGGALKGGSPEAVTSER